MPKTSKPSAANQIKFNRKLASLRSQTSARSFSFVPPSTISTAGGAVPQAEGLLVLNSWNQPSIALRKKPPRGGRAVLWRLVCSRGSLSSASSRPPATRPSESRTAGLSAVVSDFTTMGASRSARSFQIYRAHEP